MESRLLYAKLLFYTNESKVQKKKSLKIQIFLNRVTGNKNNQNICIYKPSQNNPAPPTLINLVISLTYIQENTSWLRSVLLYIFCIQTTYWSLSQQANHRRLLERLPLTSESQQKNQGYVKNRLKNSHRQQAHQKLLAIPTKNSHPELAKQICALKERCFGRNITVISLGEKNSHIGFFCRSGVNSLWKGMLPNCLIQMSCTFLETQQRGNRGILEGFLKSVYIVTRLDGSC